MDRQTSIWFRIGESLLHRRWWWISLAARLSISSEMGQGTQLILQVPYGGVL